MDSVNQDNSKQYMSNSLFNQLKHNYGFHISKSKQIQELGDSLKNDSELLRNVKEFHLCINDNQLSNHEDLLFILDFLNQQCLESLKMDLERKIINLNQSSLQKESFQYEDNTITQITKKIERFAPFLKRFEIGLASWGLNNNKVTDKSMENLGNFLQNLNQCDELAIDLFQNGLDNVFVTGNSIIHILDGIFHGIDKNIIKKLNLNFGRIGIQYFLSCKTLQIISQINNLIKLILGCSTHSSLKIFQYEHIRALCNTIEPMVDLTSLQINLRTWGYDNPQLGDASLKLLFQTIQKLKNIKHLSLDFTMWGHQNKKITKISFYRLCKCIEQLLNLKKLDINLKKFESFCWTDLRYLAYSLFNLKFLKQIQINVDAWSPLNCQRNIMEEFHYLLGRKLQINFVEDIKIIISGQSQFDKFYLKEAINLRQRDLKMYYLIQNYLKKIYRIEILQQLYELCYLDMDIDKELKMIKDQKKENLAQRKNELLPKLPSPKKQYK